jgi:hypothetical protein
LSAFGGLGQLTFLRWLLIIVKDLPQNAPEGITITEEEVSAILRGAAARILGLSN